MDDRIEHVVVLMMENRSFDHLLGYLDHPSPDFPGLERIRPDCPVDPADPDGRRVAATASARTVLGTDPDHSHRAVMLQIFGRGGTATMSGFIASYRDRIKPGELPWWGHALRWLSALWRRLRGQTEPIVAEPDEIMRCFPESEVPVLSFLAKEYAVLTGWHASVPGETWPNRQFAHAATSAGTTDIKVRFYVDDTVFERLDEAGASWGVYHDGVAQVWAYPRLWTAGTDRFHGMDRFFDDVAGASLPAYSFIEPDHGFGRGDGNSQHPGDNTAKGDSFVAGEALIARVYHALLDNPALFARTLFLVTYDEHGGFFDHVPPLTVADPDGRRDPSGFDFTHTGVRVPAVAISPLIRRGTVDPTGYCHAAIPATVRRRFAPDTAPLTARDRAAASILADSRHWLPEPRTDLPRVGRQDPEPAERAGGVRRLNDFQASLVDLAGAVRVARADGAARREATFAGPPAVPEFVPDEACRAAAAEGVLRPGSAADRSVSAVVGDFLEEPR